MRSRTGRPIDLPHHATESQLHVSVAEFLERGLTPPDFFTTFPAGWGKLTKGTAGRLYASGLKKGLPDIFVFARRKVIGIELKVPPNSVTSAQRTMFARLQAVGITVYVCHSIDEVSQVLRKAGIPCRLATSANGPGPEHPTGPSERAP